MFSTPTFDPYELFLLLITLNPKASSESETLNGTARVKSVPIVTVPFRVQTPLLYI